MDKVTLEMINLLKTRTDIAKEIGEVKKNIGKGVSDEEREDNLRNKIIGVSKEIGLDETLASKFLNFLLNESIRVQSENGALQVKELNIPLIKIFEKEDFHAVDYNLFWLNIRENLNYRLSKYFNE